MQDSHQKRSLGVQILLSLCLIGAARVSRAADVIQFPEEELASESVLPVFDNAVSVRNRNVLTARRFEVGPVLGLSLLEPFYNPLSLGATVTWHKSEEHAFNFLFSYFMQGLSNNANGLNPIPGTSTNVNLQYAPAPKYMLLGNYQYTGFYGKISVAKDFVMNLSVFSTLGLGAVAAGDGYFPAFNLGLGQKLYFTPNFALRIDFRVILYQGPDVLSRPLDRVSSEQPSSNFNQKLNYSSLLSLSAVYLFPGL